MKNVITPPYKRAPEDCVNCGPWCTDGLVNDPFGTPYLPKWDSNTPVDVTREITIDCPRIMSAAGLKEDARLRLIVGSYSGGTHLRTSLFSCDLDVSRNQSVEVKGHIDGCGLSGDLFLITRIVLPLRLPKRPLCASLSGSVLWTDKKRILLEGKSSRFPVEVVDFKEHTWADPSASWYLDWIEGRLNEPVMGALRLFVNQRSEGVMKALNATNPDPADQLILSAIYHDVGKSLLSAALSDEQFVEHPESFDSGTIGAAVRRTVNTLFPDHNTKSLHELMRNRPSIFGCLLQGRLKLFQGK